MAAHVGHELNKFLWIFCCWVAGAQVSGDWYAIHIYICRWTYSRQNIYVAAVAGNKAIWKALKIAWCRELSSVCACMSATTIDGVPVKSQITTEKCWLMWRDSLDLFWVADIKCAHSNTATQSHSSFSWPGFRCHTSMVLYLNENSCTQSAINFIH